MDRRTFSKSIASGATLAVCGLSLNGQAATALRTVGGISATTPRDGFERLIGTRYSVAGEGQGTLELASVEGASKTRPDEQFYVCFRQTAGLSLDERIYRLDSKRSKSLTLMLSPSQTRPGIMEAVVNMQTSA